MNKKHQNIKIFFNRIGGIAKIWMNIGDFGICQSISGSSDMFITLS